MAKKKCSDANSKDVKNSKYVCKKCGLKAEKESHLCKPKKK